MLIFVFVFAAVCLLLLNVKCFQLPTADRAACLIVPTNCVTVGSSRTEMMWVAFLYTCRVAAIWSSPESYVDDWPSKSFPLAHIQGNITPSVCSINNSQQWERRVSSLSIFQVLYLFYLFIFFLPGTGCFFRFQLTDFFISFMFLYEAAVALSVKNDAFATRRGIFYFLFPPERSVHYRQQMFRGTATVRITIIQSDSRQMNL